MGTANGHAFNSKASNQQASAADCDNPATYYVQCDNCDAVDTSKTVAVGTANGHAFNSKASNQQASAADCNNPATYYVQCDNCDAVDTSKTVAVGTADGHSYIQNLRGSLKTPGTCVSKAVYAVKCDNCDHEHETLTVKGELGDHTYGELIPASEAVHTATELKGAVAAHYHCACGKYFTEEFVETTLPELTSAAPVHAHDHYATTADTHQSVCVCGATIGTAEGHKGGTATCKAAAVCSVCDTAYGSKNMANHVSDEIRYLDFGDTHAVYHPCCETYEEDTAHDFNNAEHKCVCGAVETFNITWDLNGGKWIGWVRAEDSAEFDEYIQVNTAPNTKFPLEREGYTFIGFKDQDGNVYQPELTSAGSDAYVWTLGVMPGKDITLTAQWQVNQYTITWIVDGKETTSTVNHGETPVFTGSTEKADTAEWDYTFTGWSPAVVAATCDATYTAQYSQVKQTYTVTWTVNGEKYAETAVTYGEAVTAPAYEVPEGHTFSGWTVPETMPAENITLDATLTVNVYSITFLIDGQVHSTGTLQYGAAIPVPNVADREGYTFSGWGEVPATMPAHNVVINGYWTVNTYTLTIYDWMREETKIAEIQVSYGAALMDVLNTVTVADIQTDDGVFSFAGTWLYKVGQEDCANVDETTTMPASDFTVYAEFVFTGWQYGEDGVWYVVKDETQHGWKEIDGATYYLDTETGYRAEGITLVEEKYHNFAEDGKYIGLYTGVYTDELGDTYYIENGVKVANKGLVRVYENGEAKYYYFGCSATDNDSHEDNSCDPYKAQKNCAHWVENTNGLLPAWDYTFGADGVIVHDDALNNNEEQTHAVVKYEEVKFYTIDGIKVHYGLFIGEDGEYYYAKSNGELVAGRAYWISESHLNGVERNGEPVAEGSYTFDAEGRIVWPDADKDGVFEEGGKLYYYVDGERTYAGLIQYTGVCGETVYNNDWIYVRTNGELATGMYWTTKHNGHMAAASYEFDAWGRMVRENGIVEKDGVLYYYENGLPVYAGLIEIDGSYYYVRTNGQLAIGNYWITKTNGLMPEATYNFDESGKMTNAPEKSDQEKNGIYAEDGGLFYYVKGVRTYAGLIEIDGSYYYVRTNGQVAIGSYWITKTNGLMKQGMYTFDENGVMLNPSV